MFMMSVVHVRAGSAILVTYRNAAGKKVAVSFQREERISLGCNEIVGSLSLSDLKKFKFLPSK